MMFPLRDVVSWVFRRELLFDWRADAPAGFGFAWMLEAPLPLRDRRVQAPMGWGEGYKSFIRVFDA